LIVIDASAAIALVLNEDTAAATIDNLRILAQDYVIAPSHWAAEVGNALVMNVRRRRLDRSQVEFAASQLEKLRIRIEPPPTFVEMTSIAEIAIDSGLTYYDAAYVDKARSRQAALFSLDRKMRDVALRLDIPILPLN
jgi:predicted nucleic acid-binding protein